MDDKNKSRKNIEQDKDVDASLGVAKENYNEFWKEKKEECEQEKQDEAEK